MITESKSKLLSSTIRMSFNNEALDILGRASGEEETTYFHKLLVIYVQNRILDLNACVPPLVLQASARRAPNSPNAAPVRAANRAACPLLCLHQHLLPCPPLNRPCRHRRHRYSTLRAPTWPFRRPHAATRAINRSLAVRTATRVSKSVTRARALRARY